MLYLQLSNLTKNSVVEDVLLGRYNQDSGSLCEAADSRVIFAVSSSTSRFRLFIFMCYLNFI
jgi:hypothetical protein